MRGFAWLWMLGLAACTAPNPAYEGSGGETGVVDGSTTGAVGSATAVDSESSGGPVACELHPEQPLTIARYDVIERQEVLHEPDCSGAEPFVLLPIGRIMSATGEGKITHTDCDVDICSCPSANGPETVIQLEGDMLFETQVPIPLPDCGRVALWPTMGPQGCEWGGMILYRREELFPQYIASRTLELPMVGVGDAVLTLGFVGEPCTGVQESCDPIDPGAYGLGVDDQVITVEASPSYDVSFMIDGQAERYYFDNRMSSITRECEPLLAWTAQHYPPPPM